MFQGDATPEDRPELVNFFKQMVFWAVHFACIAALWTGVSWVAVIVCFALYFVRMFGITAGFHRYFSHRSFKTSRLFQFLLGYLGTSSAQKGPIWWASHHRHHHRHSDTEEDMHSPIVYGIYYAHVGWVMSSQFTDSRPELVKDLLQYPEIRWLDKYNLVPPTTLAFAVFFLGVFLNAFWPSLGTNGWQMLTWGFFISTVLLYHGTFCINSFCHLIGNKRFKTTDESRNSLLLALITLGEGWHNNHHRYPGSERQGMYWWEIDISHYIIKALSWMGLVWDIRSYPERIYQEAIETRSQLA
ncbi:MAG: acyl-CoA desaturase [Bdellovibrionales bacterium]|nr:acyl-CoA desaturase [Bdellovibrionales bacterium]